MVERKFSIDTIAEELQMEARGEGRETKSLQNEREKKRQGSTTYNTILFLLIFYSTGLETHLDVDQ